MHTFRQQRKLCLFGTFTRLLVMPGRRVGFVGPVSSRMTGQDREARVRVPRRPVDVAMVEIAQVRVEVPRLGVGICPRIRRHSAGGYA